TLLVDGNEYLHGGPPVHQPALARLSPEPVTDPALPAPQPVLTAAPPEPVGRPLSSAETFVPPRRAKPPEETSPPVLASVSEPQAAGTPFVLPPAEGSPQDAVPPLFAAGRSRPSSRRWWLFGAIVAAGAALLFLVTFL